MKNNQISIANNSVLGCSNYVKNRNQTPNGVQAYIHLPESWARSSSSSMPPGARRSTTRLQQSVYSPLHPGRSAKMAFPSSAALRWPRPTACCHFAAKGQLTTSWWRQLGATVSRFCLAQRPPNGDCRQASRSIQETQLEGVQSGGSREEPSRICSSQDKEDARTRQKKTPLTFFHEYPISIYQNIGSLKRGHIL
nr:uncharacterized protein LOC26531771 isoform X1 [Drosophila virilis]